MTDASGSFLIENLDPSLTLVVKETRTLDGYVMDDVPQTVKVRAGHTVTLEFRNSPYGGLIIQKIDTVTKKPLEGAVFTITNSSGAFVDRFGNNVSSASGVSGTGENGFASSNGLYETDAHGRITISGVTGTLVVTEIKTIAGYRINEGTRTQTVVVHPDDGQTLYFLNDPLQTLTLQKYEAGTTTPIAGVEFLVTDSGGSVVGPNNGRYVSDQNGRAVISGLTPGTTITVRETWTPSGYLLNTTPQSILIKEGDAQELTIYNEKKGEL